MDPRPVLSVDGIDLSDAEFWARPIEEREGAFLTLREQRPLPFFAEPELDFDWAVRGEGYFAVTRHADVLEVSRNPGRFCSGLGATSVIDMPAMFRDFFGSMIEMDDPRHARLRGIVSRAFTPRMLNRVVEDVRRAAVSIVGDVAAKGECDFVSEVAAALPLKVICDMVGVPASDYPRVFSCSNIILSQGDPEYIPEGSDVAAALLNAGNELSQLAQDLGRYRLEHPTDDLASALVHAEVDGERLSGEELGSFFVLLTVAGNETTRNAISHGLLALTEHPDQRRILVEDLDGRLPAAVEEIVRWATPVIFMRRTATEDTVLRGQSVRAGSKLLMFYNSANRDAEVFSDPFTFDVTRDPNPHLGFGGAGPHFCLGAHLARREIAVMFGELLRRLPDIEASAPPERLNSSFINGIKHLPCSFTPA
ncbi:MAG: cytochrome P450 [Acidimicrobiales bacterium]